MSKVIEKVRRKSRLPPRGSWRRRRLKEPAGGMVPRGTVKYGSRRVKYFPPRKM